MQKPGESWLLSQLNVTEIKGITRCRLLLTNRLTCSINHMRKCIIALPGIQNYSNHYVPALRDVNYEEKLEKLN